MYLYTQVKKISDESGYFFDEYFILWFMVQDHSHFLPRDGICLSFSLPAGKLYVQGICEMPLLHNVNM